MTATGAQSISQLFSIAAEPWSFEQLTKHMSNEKNFETVLEFFRQRLESKKYGEIDPIILARFLLCLKFISKKALPKVYPCVCELFDTAYEFLLKINFNDPKNKHWIWVNTILHLHATNHGQQKQYC